MKITGIIMECNPFHKGHRYLLEKAREQTGADRIVVVMSGNFVQRGAPAIMNKETRARQILENGADLVLALPLYSACAGADYFARGGIALLESLGCVDTLCFGSESGDISLLLRISEMLTDEDSAFKTALQQGLKSGLTYPQARSRAAGQVCGVSLPGTPNDLLALEYCRAIKRMGSSMSVCAVKRTAAPSASSLRASMLRSEIPPDPLFFSYKKSRRFLSADSFSQALLEALLGAFSDGTLPLYLDVSRELAGRITRNLMRYENFSSFCSLIKTRNITYTRAARALTHILLGMRVSEMDAMEQAGMCPYIRPLGFRREASDLLHVIDKNRKVPFLSRLSGAERELSPSSGALLKRELSSDMLYELVSCEKGQAVSEFQKGLIIL